MVDTTGSGETYAVAHTEAANLLTRGWRRLRGICSRSGVSALAILRLSFTLPEMEDGRT
jgi:hypothetical protein